MSQHSSELISKVWKGIDWKLAKVLMERIKRERNE